MKNKGGHIKYGLFQFVKTTKCIFALRTLTHAHTHTYIYIICHFTEQNTKYKCSDH